MSDILGEKLQSAEFHLVSLSTSAVFIILFLAFLTVYLSAIVPARKSAKLNIIEGLTGITGEKIKYGKSKIYGKAENTLAKDYFRTYISTYKTILLSMLLSALVMTIVLVSQSYRSIDEIYGQYNDKYNFQSQIFSDSNLNEQLVNELYELEQC